VLDLDDEDALLAADPGEMLDAFASMPEQLERSYRSVAERRDLPEGFSSVMFCGMGGSASAADLVTALLSPAATTPLTLHRGATLPAWVGKETLVVAISYSGGTEETIGCLGEALSRGCPAVAIAGGGELLETAVNAGAAAIRIEADAPMPRAALGDLGGSVLGLVNATGIDRVDQDQVTASVRELRDTAARLAPARPSGSNEAKQLARWLGDLVPVIWGTEGLAEPVAMRWKAAFNENAKLPAFASSLPELAHHEVVGWTRSASDRFAVLALRGGDESERAQERLAAAFSILEDAGIAHREISVPPASPPLARSMGLALVGDLASTYHALGRGIDPAPIDAIHRLKGRLK